MKRSFFYREYYQRTDEFFADHIVWNNKDLEKAWQKGQARTSKMGRKLYLAFQYLFFLGGLIWMCVDIQAWRSFLCVILVSIVISLITNFSILKIELLYHLYKRNTVYSNFLHQMFLGRTYSFFEDLRRATKQHVRGYNHKIGIKSIASFYGKFSGLCKNNNHKILLTFTYKNVKIKVNGRTVVLNAPLLSQKSLIEEIAIRINSEMQKN